MSNGPEHLTRKKNSAEMSLSSDASPDTQAPSQLCQKFNLVENPVKLIKEAEQLFLIMLEFKIGESPYLFEMFHLIS